MKFTGEGRKRTAQGMAEAAGAIGCDEAVLRAVVAVEAAGRGFDDHGRVTALFEPHVFYRQLADTPARKRAMAAKLAYPNWVMGSYPHDSYPRIEAACLIDETAALKATSWGLPQILGENFKPAGFDSPQAMVVNFAEGEDEQLRAMGRFIVASKLAPALREHDFEGFARGYNGAGYERNGYPARLAQAFARELRTARAAAPREAPAAVAKAPATKPPVDKPPVDKPPVDKPPLVAVLRYGAKGEAVRRLQRGLVALGAKLEVDDEFGSRTHLAVQKFQERHGLPQTGEADQATLDALAGALRRSIAQGAKTMDGVKGFFASKTIWANIVGFAATLPFVGKYLAGVDLDATFAALSAIVASFSFLGSTIARIMATKQIAS